MLPVYPTDAGTWTAQRIGAGGATIGPAIALGAGDAASSPLTATASIAFDGAHYWAAWTRRAPSDPLETNRSAIFARRFAPDESLPDAAEEILLDGPMTDLHPVLAGGSGAVLALEERFVLERPYGAMRVLYALASDAPLMCVGSSDGASCDDGDPCTGPDRCASGACSAALSCDDGDACTTDACDPASGCAHTAIAGCCRAEAECDDGDACTADPCSRDTCEGAACAHEPICEPDVGVSDRDAGASDRDAGARARDAGASDRDAGPPDGGGSDCTCGIAARGCSAARARPARLRPRGASAPPRPLTTFMVAGGCDALVRVVVPAEDR